MNTWQNLLLVVAVMGAVAAAETEPCDIDKPGLSEEERLNTVFQKMLTCYRGTITEAQRNQLQGSSNLETYRTFFKDFCPRVQEVTSCMADIRTSLLPCHNKNASLTFTILSEITEHMMTSGCENEGDRLAHLARGSFLLMKKKDTLVPLRRCMVKGFAFMKLANDNPIDMASESFIYYHEFAKLKKCMKHVEDEDYKSVAQWMLDLVAEKMTCKNPDDDTTVLCSTVEADKVPVHDVCKLEPLKPDHLFDQVEEMAAVGCYVDVFSYDKVEGAKYTDIEWLKEQYKSFCQKHHELPKCLLQASAYGETCLSQEEDKQFQLEVQAMEDAMARNCVEEGTRLATVMQEVYTNTAEHGHALRDCYKTVEEASKAHEGHAVSTKNMRFYHDTIAYKQCVVEKLHATNDLAKNVETAFNDVLKKMKCVNPHDGSVVLCESIHEH